MVRVLIADDHGVVRKGLRFLLQNQPLIEVVGEAGDGRQAVAMAGELLPDIVLMDVAMPNLNGIDAAAQIVGQNPQIGIIMLSMHSDEGYLLRALSVGVRGYLLKTDAESQLPDAVQAVSRGRPYFSPSITKTLLEDYVQNLQKVGKQDSFDLLTDREKEILQLIAEGRSNREVAAVLSLSPYTVETHRTRMMQKLNLHSTAEIVLYAVRKRIIS